MPGNVKYCWLLRPVSALQGCEDLLAYPANENDQEIQCNELDWPDWSI